jgi:chemotaxis-related protein WspB
MTLADAAPASASKEAGDLYLLFSLQGDRYALSVHEVVEVLPLRRCKALPEAPAWVAGLLEYRGELVPVIDLSARASGRPATELASTRLVLVCYKPAGRVLGLILEKATDTLRLPASGFRESSVAVASAAYLGAVQHQQQGLIQRIDVDGLLPADVSALLFPCMGQQP